MTPESLAVESVAPTIWAAVLEGVRVLSEARAILLRNASLSIDTFTLLQFLCVQRFLPLGEIGSSHSELLQVLLSRSAYEPANLGLLAFYGGVVISSSNFLFPHTPFCFGLISSYSSRIFLNSDCIIFLLSGKSTVPIVAFLLSFWYK